jgi:hypothetical protein
MRKFALIERSTPASGVHPRHATARVIAQF